MRILWVFIALVPLNLAGQATDVAAQLASMIQSESLKQHVYRLASPEFQGRETGTEGNQMAADYIAQQLAAYGIPVIPGDTNHFQEVAFTSVRWKEVGLEVQGQTEEHMKDFLCFPQYFAPQDAPVEISEMLFLGFGIDDENWSDYAGVNVAGKHLIVYGTEPKDEKGIFLLTGTNKPSEWTMDPTLRIQAAKDAGAASLWIIDDKLRDKILFARRYMLGGATLMGTPEDLARTGLPHALVSPALGQRLTGDYTKRVIKARKRMIRREKPVNLSFPVDVKWNPVHQLESTPGVNVLGYVEGTDPALKDELIIVSAHFDHLGMRGKDVYHGADDNASGTGAVLEVAKAMATAKTMGEGPRRSVLCLFVTGEEKGLLGSEYYSEHPVFPLEQTVANVNIDMIGRTDAAHDHAHYTYVIGSDRLSTELHAINESVNKKYLQLELDYTYNADDDPNRFYYRSDHYNFAKKGIPAIFFFSGVHDDYHRPTDTPDKIMYGKAEKIARLAFHTAWELANRNERIRVDVTGRN